MHHQLLFLFFLEIALRYQNRCNSACSFTLLPHAFAFTLNNCAIQAAMKYTWAEMLLPSPTCQTICGSGCASLLIPATPSTSAICCCGVVSTSLPFIRARGGAGSLQVNLSVQVSDYSHHKTSSVPSSIRSLECQTSAGPSSGSH